MLECSALVALPHKNGDLEDLGLAAGWSEVPRQAALAQLARVLDSPQFHSSKRCSLFLRYVVEQAVERRLDCLKERTLGIAVFDRDPHYDTNQDPIVRSTAGEVRKRLAQYYLDPGHDDELRIGIPTGSYMPEVHPPAERTEPVLGTVVLPRPVSRPGRWWIAAAVFAVAVAAAGYLYFRKTDLDRFWAPLIDGQGPLLVCLGQPRAYGFTPATEQAMDDWFDKPDEPRNPPPEIATIPLSAVVPSWTRYTGVGNAQALARISWLMAIRGKRIQVRGGRSLSLADLRGKPAVLIGAFSNQWTLDLTGHLRFYFEGDPKNSTALVRDRRNPGMTDWKVVEPWVNPKSQVDYAIISRVLDATTEQVVVVVAGITHLGTQAAGEFLTNPEYFAEAVKQAPHDWSRKNMQIVISAKVMRETAGPPQVTAVDFW
jgi:hypothetical protein